MTTCDAARWTDYSEALAFAGNSLLAPMSQTGAIGLEPAFWAGFPNFDDTQVGLALEALEGYAQDARALSEPSDVALSHVSAEYTKLFIGPPRPAAPPWETMHRGDGNTVGFGKPTFAMQRLLREAGLEVSNENNQYADHIGIELLYASTLCARLAEMGDAEDAVARAAVANQLAMFVQEHPLGWIDRLIAAVDESAPGGYIANLLVLAKALLITLVE